MAQAFITNAVLNAKDAAVKVTRILQVHGFPVTGYTKKQVVLDVNAGGVLDQVPKNQGGDEGVEVTFTPGQPQVIRTVNPGTNQPAKLETEREGLGVEPIADPPAVKPDPKPEPAPVAKVNEPAPNPEKKV
jgi:hypothetical protein